MTIQLINYIRRQDNNFRDLRKRYGTSSAEQKLIILRRELLRPIVTVESSAHLLQTASDRICSCLPEEISAEEYKNTKTWLTEAARIRF